MDVNTITCDLVCWFPDLICTTSHNRPRPTTGFLLTTQLFPVGQGDKMVGR